MIHKKRAKSEGKVVSIDAESETFVTFRPVYVFDQSQTEGDPLPDLHSTRVEGDATVYLERLTKHVTDSGITLEFGDPTMGADGLSYGGKIMLPTSAFAEVDQERVAFGIRYLSRAE